MGSVRFQSNRRFNIHITALKSLKTGEFRMRHWLRSVIEIREGEMLITGLMILYIYLTLVTYYLLNPARDSLFLTGLGAER